MRTIEIISTSSGIHYLLFGMNADELGSFSASYYITKFGKRAIDWMQSLSMSVCSFMGGDLYVHNSDLVPRANLYGEQRDVKVGVVANQDSNLVKILDSIGIHSDGKWEVESLTIPHSLNNPDGMFSMIPKERFKKRESIWQAEFLRNMKTSSGNLSAIEAVKGESLRGESAYLILKNTDTTETKLFKIDINMTKNR